MKRFIIPALLLITAGLVWKFSPFQTGSSVEDLREQYAAYWNNHPYSKTIYYSKEQRKEAGLPPNAYFEQEYLLEMNPATGRTEPEKLLALQEKLERERAAKSTPGYGVNEWEERGPFNVPGRARAVMFDPNDNTHQRVFAGGVSGGLFVNDNIETPSTFWERVGIPENLSISSMTYDMNNPQNMFIGTGESYVGGSVNGNGIWRSTDGGETWEHIFGGSTGNVYFSGNAQLTVNSPAGIAGTYTGIQSDLGGPDPSGPITADLVLVDDGSANPSWGCNPLVNAADVNGKIAVIERGECYFVDKIMNAQNAGAVAVVMINNVDGPPIIMGGNSSTINIPSFMISRSDGQIIMDAMENDTVNATFEFLDADTPSGLIIPGIYHINDITTRDNNGTTEIYAAVSDSYGGGGIMGADSFGLYKSTDNGDTWEKIDLPVVPGASNQYMPNKILIAPDNKIWVTTTPSASYSNGGGTVLSSTDGENFEAVYTVPGNSKRTELAISATDPDKMYLLVDHATAKVLIFKTTDGFDTNPTSLPKPADADPGIPSNDFTRGQAFYDLTIAVDPNDDEIVYVGGVDSFRSADGGNTWQQMSRWTSMNISVPYVHADIHNIVFHPADSDKGLIATDGGIFYADSFADATQEVNNAIGTRQWYFNTTQFYKGAISQNPNIEILLGGAQDNGSLLKYGADPGINMFTEAFGGDGTYCFIDKDNEYMIVSLPGNNFFLLSIFGAYQETLINENTGFFVNIAELDDNMDILYTNASTASANRIARISDITGNPVRTNLTNDDMLGTPTALKASPFTTGSSTLFVGTSRGNLFKLTNADSSPTWEMITGDGFFGSVSSINFGNNEDEILVTFHNYGVNSVWYSPDGGNTWENKEGDLPDIPVKDILMNPMRNQEVIIATDLGVWMTKDFFAENPHWEQSQNGMQNVKVTSFDFRETGHTVLASTYGRGLFTGRFTQFPASVSDDELATGITVYPNVSGGTFYIKSQTEIDGCTIIIYDAGGRKVWQDRRDISAEPTEVSTGLMPGMYFLHIVNGQNDTGRKIIIE